jgi:hypothetical protein
MAGKVETAGRNMFFIALVIIQSRLNGIDVSSA